MVGDLQFTASIFNSLAWPTVVVIVAVLLRRELANAIRRLTSLEFRGAKINFDVISSDFQQIERISEAAASDALAGDTEALAIMAEPEFTFLDALAESAPRRAIIEAWRLLEYQLDVAADRMAPTQSHGWPQVAEALENWNQWRVLSPVVAELRRLRDYTARATQQPLNSDAIRYVAVVQDVVTTLRASFKPAFDDRAGDDR